MDDYNRDLQFMSQCENWPLLHLPVKLRNGNPFAEGGMGVMFAPELTGPAKPVVYIGDMFTIDPKTCEKREYKNLSELALEWRVD